MSTPNLSFTASTINALLALLNNIQGNLTRGQAANYASLPDAADHNGEFWAVLNSTWLSWPPRWAGTYLSDGTTWTRSGALVELLNDANFVLVDDSDTTKQVKFQLSSISTGTTRTLTVPNKDGTFALLDDIISSYNDLTDTPSVPTALSELSEDATHRTVTDTEKSTWNAKSNFSGAYADLTGKPTLGTAADNAETDFATASQGALADSAVQPGEAIPTGDVTAIDALSQEAYDALGTPSATTLYLITS